MGVDYRAVSGFALKIPKRTLTRLKENHEVNEDDALFDKVGIGYELTGCSYSEETVPRVIFQPDPRNVDKQLSEWLDDVNECLETEFTIDDVEFLSELYIY